MYIFLVPVDYFITQALICASLSSVGDIIVKMLTFGWPFVGGFPHTCVWTSLPRRNGLLVHC